MSMGGGKMTLREICSEYSREIIFGSVLLACVVVSYMLAPLIPIDCFRSIIYPAQNVAIITVLMINTWAMFTHSEGIRARYVYAWITGTLSVLIIASSIYRMFVNAELNPAEGTFSFEGWEMVVGDLIAWLLLAYPLELLRPGWLTYKNALIRLLPVVIIGGIDVFTPLDLRWLLALIPAVWVALLFRHVYYYRKYCEENFSSTEQTDEKWVIRYLVMMLVLGISYVYLCFSDEPTRFFTPNWLRFFVFVYTNDQIIFRSKPWIEDAEKETNDNEPVLEKPEPETDEEPTATNAEYREMLEQWMKTEKPYLNPEFRLLDMRQVLPLNRTYLSQLINAEYGCNFYQFVTNYRIEEAKQLMMDHPGMKMQDVAEQCGFSSPTVFARIFARETGISPSDWNQKQAKK